MIPTGSPRMVRAARFAQVALRGGARPTPLLVVAVAFCLAASGPSAHAQQHEPAEAATQQSELVTDEPAAVPPPAPVAEPADNSTDADADLPPAADELLPLLRGEECCPLSDGCCPVFDGATGVGEGCCPDFDAGCDWLDPDPDCCEIAWEGCDAICGPRDADFYLGLEFGVLTPEVDPLDLSQITNTGTIRPDHSYQFAPRFFGGFQARDGWGGQISYWTFETGNSRTSLPDVFHDLDLQTVDVDLLKTWEVEGWSVQIGAGGRWGDIESAYFNALNANQRLTTDFEGTGPTVLLNIRRPLGCGNWALVGEGRASFLFGDTTLDAPLAPTLRIDDDLVEIWEGRAGLEWTGPAAKGNSLFFVRALIEGQYWSMPGVGSAGRPDINFLGPTVSMGFVF